MNRMRTRGRHGHGGIGAAAVAAALAALLVAGCAAPPAASTAVGDGKSAVVYTERGAEGEPVDVLVVFDADGRLIGTRTTAVAGVD